MASNLDALNAFRGATNWEADAIANINGGNVEQNGVYTNRFSAIRRLPADRDRNNAMRTARKNLNTLSTLIALQFKIDSAAVADIIKKVDGWEDKLAECSSAGNPDSIDDINNDLQNFLVENRATIEPLLKEVPIGMGEKYDS